MLEQKAISKVCLGLTTPKKLINFTLYTVLPNFIKKYFKSWVAVDENQAQKVNDKVL